MNFFEVSAVTMLPAGCWWLGRQHQRFDGPFQRPPDVPELVTTAGAGYFTDCFFFPFSERDIGMSRLPVPTLLRSDYISRAWVGVAEITMKYQR